jgi:hypothetical protein
MKIDSHYILLVGMLWVGPVGAADIAYTHGDVSAADHFVSGNDALPHTQNISISNLVLDD